MKKLLFSMLVFYLISSSPIIGQVAPKDKGFEAITMDAIKGQLKVLSSDWTEGRSTGDKGFYLASDYVVSMLKFFGASPAGNASMGRGARIPRGFSGAPPAPSKSYFQNFTLIESQQGGKAL